MRLLRRYLDVPLVFALLLGAGFAIRVSPAHAQDVTEDWPKQASSALRHGNCDLALELIHGARRTKDPLGDSVLGGLYQYGQCVDQDLPQALALYRAADAQGNGQAAPLIGYFYLKGLGTRTNRETARYWFKKAVLSNVLVPPNLRKQFLQLELLDLPVPPELEEELDWMSRIELGDAETQYEMALRVRDGNGMPRVIRAAKTWLGKAGDKGFPKAHFELGLMLLSEDYGERKPSTGLFMLSMAARAGYGPAQKVVAGNFASGLDTPRWDFAAYVWYLVARENGEDVASALVEVGERLDDVERSVAAEWAAEPGRPPLVPGY